MNPTLILVFPTYRIPDALISNSPFIPRIGDRIAYGSYPFYLVKSVTWYVDRNEIRVTLTDES